MAWLLLDQWLQVVVSGLHVAVTLNVRQFLEKVLVVGLGNHFVNV